MNDFNISVFEKIKFNKVEQIQVKITITNKKGSVLALRKVSRQCSKREINRIIKECKSKYQEGINIIL